MNGSFTGILGDRGNGKSLLLTMLVYSSNVPVITNVTGYKNLRKNTEIIPFELEMLTDHNFLRNKKLYLDEAQFYANSRKFMSLSNEIISGWSQLCRKDNCEGILVFQKLRTIDVNLRDQFDFLIECSKNDETNDITYIIKQRKPESYMALVYEEKFYRFFYDKYDSDENPALLKTEEQAFKVMKPSKKDKLAKERAKEIFEVLPLKNKTISEKRICGYLFKEELLHEMKDKEYVTLIKWYLDELIDENQN